MKTPQPMKTRQQAGLTLVEIIVAIGVFSIIMLALSGTIVQGLQIRRNNSIEAQGLTYAASSLEQYKNLWANYENYRCFHPDGIPGGRNVEGCDLANTYKVDLPAPPAIFQANYISFECLDLKGDPYPETKCTGNNNSFIPELRRVTVTLKDQQGKVRAQLFTEIGNPLPSK
jgi:prepilin-type N-terminal cleavage/methylation domain-containing protein